MRRLGSDFIEYPDYFSWLAEIVYVDGRYTDESYWILAKILWQLDFCYILDQDQNREGDGEYLRYKYSLIGGTDPYDGPCTVLEALVGIADRMDTMMDDLDGETKLPMFFWEMIDNLGLSNFSDQFFEENEDEREVYKRRIENKIKRWLYREFDPSGHGSPFPLERPREDQREVEIWYQMNAYLIERHPD